MPIFGPNSPFYRSERERQYNRRIWQDMKLWERTEKRLKQVNREIDLAKDNKRLFEENNKLRQLLRERVQDNNSPFTETQIDNIEHYVPKDLNTEFVKEHIPVPVLLEPYGPVLEQVLDISVYCTMTACCLWFTVAALVYAKNLLSGL